MRATLWMGLILSVWAAAAWGEASRTVPTTATQEVILQYEAARTNQTADQVTGEALARGLRELGNRRIEHLTGQWAQYFRLLTPTEQTAEIARITSEITRLQAR